MKHMITPKKLASQLKENINCLWENKCGCCHWHLLTDDKGRRWSIVVGWSYGFGEDEDGYFSDGAWQICSKIAYQEKDNAMQTDFDLDFTMPYDEKTGEVDDTCSAVSRSEDYNRLAEDLLKAFKRVTDTWAYFENEEESVA